MRSAIMGLQLRQCLRFKRAAVAVARKLAVIMHSMLSTGEPFRGGQATV
jgi:transposase